VRETAAHQAQDGPVAALLRNELTGRRFAPVTTDPYADLRDRVIQRVLEGPGESASSVRMAAADGSGMPAALQSVIEKIHSHAYKVTDADVAALEAAFGEDGAFEVIVSAALGASRKRLLAGLRAMELA
jgi:hypothetical protein